MAPANASSRLLDRVRTVQNLVVAVAVVLAVPAGLSVASATGETAPGFLLLVLVGVGVPTAYDRRWHETYASPGRAVAWTIAASAVVAAVYLGLFWLLGSAVGPGLLAPAVAFVGAWGIGALVDRVVEGR